MAPILQNQILKVLDRASPTHTNKYLWTREIFM